MQAATRSQGKGRGPKGEAQSVAGKQLRPFHGGRLSNMCLLRVLLEYELLEMVGLQGFAGGGDLRNGAGTSKQGCDGHFSSCPGCVYGFCVAPRSFHNRSHTQQVQGRC